ncbi:MAG TPA: CRISPR system precrRNA processing endoribonuclease RAMP protein Cas6 [Chloroflexi bacterium]|nr:CRISPR system precrRNA processing endoribonuclease RAMP protein Cas6 [Chloroflexota bacterium]
MEGFSVTHLRFTVEPVTLVQFGTQPGSQLRGALYNVLRRHTCTLRPDRDPTPAHTAICPVCRLLAPRNPDAARGHTPPPPLALQPPPGDRRTYRPGQTFSFGISLFGDQSELLPYVIHGVWGMGREGVGQGRGRFEVRDIEAVHPLTRQRESLLLPDGRIRQPELRVSASDVDAAAHTLPSDGVTLHFLTPTRLIANGRPIALPPFEVLIGRLLERIDLLLDEYAPAAPRTPHAELAEQAQAIRLAWHRTRWVSIRSGSRRQGRTTPIGGFVGHIHYEGNLRPFLPWLIWGQSVQVGKNTAKGDGWYEIVPPSD